MPAGKQTVGSWFVGAYFVVGIAYLGYSWYSYTGIYRWFVEWQLAHFGSYDVKLSIAVPFIVVALPGTVIGRLLFGPRQQQLRTVSARGSSPWPVALIGLLALVVAAGAGWLGYQKANEPVTVEPLDLGDHRAPQGTHVRLTGIAYTRLFIQFERKTAGSSRVENYVPLVAQDWRPGQPLAYFLKSQINGFQAADGHWNILQSTSPPFKLTQEGVLMSDGLPGPIAEEYRKNGIPLADKVLVLDTEPGADLMIYWYVAGGGVLISFCTLLAAMMLAARGRRMRQA